VTTSETTTMGPVLIPYSRFSRGRQEAGVSQERQDEMAQRAAAEEGVEVDRTLSLKDKGVSAFRGANWRCGDLGKFIDLVDAGVVPKGSILCFERVNRLSRTGWREQARQWTEILSRGIIIRTCEPPARYTNANIDELAVGCPVVIAMMLGHAESKQKSDWACDAFRRMRDRTRAEKTPHKLRTPAWVKQVTESHPRDPERRIVVGYTKDEQRAAVLRRMHELIWDGWGARRVWQWLMADVAPWGKPWQLGTVQYLLRTRTALGEYQPKKLDEAGNARAQGEAIQLYPELLSEDEWRRTQTALAGRRRKGGRPGRGGRIHLLSHLLRDARDGSAMHAAVASARKGKKAYSYPVLSCVSRRWSVPEDLFERSVLFTLAQLRARDVDGRHQADALSVRAEVLQQERSRLGLDLDTLDRQVRELPAERWPARVVVRMAELEEAIRMKDAELQEAREAASVSARTAALDDLQTCLQRLDEIERMKDGPPKEDTRRRVRERIKGRLPSLVESIWVRVQIENKASKFVHVRLYLQGGETRYWVLTVGRPGGDPLPLRDCDFRGGEERGYAIPAYRRLQLPAGPLAR